MLGNKEVAARLFVSPRTVQAHRTHVYTKLGLTSRARHAQETARHNCHNYVRLRELTGSS
ncbi:MAG TPA: helix-turn-helix transcriptional regulator [Mycobacterium sp.]|nr:helix-turn-helix transcriptional regulator [Mycobacterium sp.]